MTDERKARGHRPVGHVPPVRRPRLAPQTKRVALSGAVSFGAALTAACGPFGPSGQGGAGSPDVGGQAKNKAPIVLRVHTRTGLDLDRYFLTRKGDFETVLPHVTLELDVISGSPPEYITKLLVVHSAGELGDAAWGTSRAGYTKLLAAKGAFAPVEPLAKADKLALTDYYPNALEGGMWQGKLWALPHLTEPGWAALHWNKNLLGAAGVSAPRLDWTYDSLRAAAVELSKGPAQEREQYGYAGNFGYLSFMPVLRAFDGDLLSPDGTRCVLDTPAGLAAVQWHHDMIHRHAATPAPGRVPGDGFGTGTLAMRNLWATPRGWLLKEVDGRFDVGTGLMPKGPRGTRGSMLTTHTMSVVAKTRHMDEAWAWTKWSCSREFALHRVASGNGAPVGRSDVWHDDRVKREYPDPEWSSWAELMQKAIPNYAPANLRGKDVEDTLDEQLGLVWQGKVGPADGVKQTVAAMQEVLRRTPM